MQLLGGIGGALPGLLGGYPVRYFREASTLKLATSTIPLVSDAK
jgi:hypothetical protein